MRFAILLLPILILALPVLARAQTGDESLKAVTKLLSQGKADEALALAQKAVKDEPKNPNAYLARGYAYEVLEKHTEAIADFNKTIELEPKSAAAYNHRGSEQFKLGKIAESLEDFDKYLALEPKELPEHWKRGISLYYLGKFEEAKKQFESHQTVNSSDVENAVWHFLCNARLVGVEKARAQLIPIEKDSRIPLMEVHALFKGNRKVEDILTAANAGKPSAAELNRRLFYAHLYLGLYFEALGDKKKALEHMTKSAKDHALKGYMWDVARVHMELLQKEEKPK